LFAAKAEYRCARFRKMGNIEAMLAIASQQFFDGLEALKLSKPFKRVDPGFSLPHAHTLGQIPKTVITVVFSAL